MAEDNFFTQSKCDRCNQELKVRTMSWFTNETICIDCSEKEKRIKEKLPNYGKDFEGCGYLPIIDIESIISQTNKG